MKNKIDHIYYIIVIMCLIMFTFYLYLIIADSNWYFGDLVFFTETIKNGTPAYLFSSAAFGDGRFYPFAYLEFGVLKNLGDIPILYYLIQIVKCVLFVIALGLISREILRNIIKPKYDYADFEKRYKTAKICNILIIFGLFPLMPISMIFLEIMYPESMQVVWIGFFILFLLYGKRKNSSALLAISAICGLIMLYYKEPTFIIPITFATTNFLFNWKNISKKMKVFYVILIIFAVSWLLQYYFLVRVNVSKELYGIKISSSNTFQSTFFHYYIKEFSVLFVFLLLGIYRFSKSIKIKFAKQLDLDENRIIFDSTLYSGLAYIFAFVLLKMQSHYYHSTGIVLCYIAALYYVSDYMVNGSYKTLKQLLHRPITITIIALFFLGYFGNSSVKRTFNHILTIKNYEKHHIPLLKEVLPDSGSVTIISFNPISSIKEGIKLNHAFNCFGRFAKLYSNNVILSPVLSNSKDVSKVISQNPRGKYIILAPANSNIQNQLKDLIQFKSIDITGKGIFYSILTSYKKAQ